MPLPPTGRSWAGVENSSNRQISKQLGAIYGIRLRLSTKFPTLPNFLFFCLNSSLSYLALNYYSLMPKSRFERAIMLQMQISLQLARA
jgi:hypothetical protein